MLPNPSISVIIPHYNHEAALARSLRSLAAQTLQPSEVIIVDDGSAQAKNVPPMLLSFPRLRIRFLQQDHRGASAARNNGFKQSTGDFVIFWDADTIARPTMLEMLYASLDKTPAADYCYCPFSFGWKTIKSPPFSVSLLKEYNYIDTTSLIRRSALIGINGPFDETLQRFQDWDLWLTLLEKGSVGVQVPRVLFKKIVFGRKGMSAWLPSFAYGLPLKRVQKYDKAAAVVRQKHGLRLL